MTHSAPLRERLTEQWLNEQWPNEQWLNVICTQEQPLDSTVASAQDCSQVPARLHKKITRQCSLSISGTMENHNTHLTPGFSLNNLAPAPVNVAVFWGLL